MTSAIDRRIRDDQWWGWTAAIAGVVIGVLSLAEDYSSLAAALIAVSLAGWLTNAGWRRLPSLVLALWTGVPPVILVGGNRAEGAMFLVVLLAAYVALLEPDLLVRTLIGTAAITTPLLVLVAGERADFGGLYWMMGIAFGWVSGALLSRQRRLLDEVESTRRLLADRAVLEERRRIALDLHDLVGHSLTVVMLHLTGARRLIRRNPTEAEAALLEAETVGRQSLADMRRSVRLLKEGATRSTAPSPTAGDIPELVERYAKAGMRLAFTVEGSLEITDQAVSLAAYRIVQESLANAARHAPGSAVSVSLSHRNGSYGITVENRGGAAGHDGATGGIGIAGIRERASSLGGSLRAGPMPQGWRVEATLPLDDPEASTP